MTQIASDDFSDVNFDSWLLEEESSNSSFSPKKNLGLKKKQKMTRQKLIENSKKRVEEMFTE